jgi:hypothetical protein
MIRAELNASPELVITTELPPKMTLIKRPTLDRQRTLLGVEPCVGIVEGVRRVCSVHSTLPKHFGSRSGFVERRRAGHRLPNAAGPRADFVERRGAGHRLHTAVRSSE